MLDYFLSIHKNLSLHLNLGKTMNLNGCSQLVLSSGKFNSNMIITLLENQDTVDRLDSIDIKKFTLILNSDKFYSNMIITLLENQHFFDRLNSIDIERFKLILNSDKFYNRMIMNLLENQDTVDRLNSIDIEKLGIIISNTTNNDLIAILISFEIDVNVRSNLGFAIALCKAGKISSISIDYLRNDDAVCNDIIGYLSNKIFRDNIINRLVRHTFENRQEGPVSKLQDLCINQIIMSTSSMHF